MGNPLMQVYLSKQFSISVNKLVTSLSSDIDPCKCSYYFQIYVSAFPLYDYYLHPYNYCGY
jgi:hypothetical protein